MIKGWEIMIPPNVPKALAEAIVKILEAKKRLSGNALRMAEKNYHRIE